VSPDPLLLVLVMVLMVAAVAAVVLLLLLLLLLVVVAVVLLLLLVVVVVAVVVVVVVVVVMVTSEGFVPLQLTTSALFGSSLIQGANTFLNACSSPKEGFVADALVLFNPGVPFS
jgi:hypothetical protein